MATQLHQTTSPPTPVIETPPRTIAEEINAATVNLHHDLNILISSRIPYGLPPKSSDPSLYALGLDAFATVYFTFEEAHEQFNSSALNESKNPHTRHAMRKFLRYVIPDNLRRTSHLRKDINYLTRSSHKNAQLKLNSTVNKPLHRWVKDIYSNVRSKPHLLIAYFWTMYMAIFAGGRFIREILADAGEDFWDSIPVSALSEGQQQDSNRSSPTTPQLESGPPLLAGLPPLLQKPATLNLTKKNKRASLTHLGYTFLSFSPPAKYDPVTGDDGASIRNDFLERLKGAEELLTREERDDIVAEAQSVFLRLMDVVNALDEEYSGKIVYADHKNTIVNPRSQNEKESLSQEEDLRRMRIVSHQPSQTAVPWRTKVADLGKLLAATIAFTAFWYLMVLMFF